MRFLYQREELPPSTSRAYIIDFFFLFRPPEFCPTAGAPHRSAPYAFRTHRARRNEILRGRYW